MKLLIVSLLFLACWGVNGQVSIVHIYGAVSDSVTGAPLTGATIDPGNAGKGTITDAEGKFLVLCKRGDSLHLNISYLGYKPAQVFLVCQSDTMLRMLLADEPLEAGEVTISTDQRNREKQQSSTLIRVQGKEIRQLPRLMGESDVMRTLQYTPGVSFGGDANAGLYVRGGGADQNLILLDNAPVFNPSHLLGFFSTFNSQVVQSLEFFRNGAPVNYSSRLSSVVDVTTVYPNSRTYATSGNIGIVSSNLSVAGPMIKEKLSIYLAGRKTYIDEVLKPAFNSFLDSESPFIENTRYNFYDANAKIALDGGRAGRFALSGFASGDNFSLEDLDINYNNSLHWGNKLAALNWTKETRKGWLLKSSATWSDYAFRFAADRSDMNVELFSSVTNAGISFGAEGQIAPALRLMAGGSVQHYKFRPNNLQAKAAGLDLKFGSNQQLQNIEAAAYLQTDWKMIARWTLSAGLRVSAFVHTGPYNALVTDATGEISDTLTYQSNDILQTYYLPEPRISATYQLSQRWKITAGYTHNEQALHQVSSTTVTLPIDIFLPSTAQVRPQKSDQFFVSANRLSAGNSYEIEANLYYKKLDNQIELLYGIINDFQDNLFENSMTFGQGESYGAEMMLRRKTGKLTGWVSYTLARTVRQFDEINDGYVYPATFDRRHQLTAIANYPLGRRWTVSASFMYATGQAMTIPEGKYLISGNLLNINSETNGFRMPAYHRLDISVNYFFRKEENRESGLNLSIFNAYNRPNPFYITFIIEGDNTSGLSIKARGVSVFPILPSLSWFFRF